MKTNFNYKMNNKDAWMLVFSIAFLIFFILIFIRAVRVDDEPIQEVENVSLLGPFGSQSITFIVGKDKDQKNPFYTNAERYFQTNPNAITDEVFTDAESLQEIFNTLNTLYRRNGKKFKRINVVVHSNPWSGMNLAIEPQGERINAEILNQAIDNGSIKYINDSVINDQTIIEFHACGLGENQELIKALTKVFSGKLNQNPEIRAAEEYVNFTRDNERVNKSEMEVYYAFYRTAYKPADLHLARQLRNRYPDIEINWLEAIQSNDGNNNRPFSYKYNVPIEWEIMYPEYDPPTLATEMDKMEWIMNQDELMETIEKTAIPFDKFRWIVKSGNKLNDDNLEVPYIKVYGKVTILCILVPKENNSQEMQSTVKA